jgi:hypothetical protein
MIPRDTSSSELCDTPETLNYEQMVRVVTGVAKVGRYLGK